MTPNEKKKISNWNDSLSKDIQITLVLSEDKRDEQFVEFCRRFSKIAPRVSVSQKKDDNAQVPSIQINHNLRFMAIPLGRELEPFLETLTPGNNDIKTSISRDLKKIGIPALLNLFVAKQCTFCPSAIRQLAPLAFANELIRVTIIDSVLFPEIAEENNVQSVPLLLLDDNFRWTGAPPIQEAVNLMINRDPSKLGSGSLKSMLQEGGATKVAEMMLDANKLFPAFLELLIDEKWPVRLGAIVVMEELIEKDAELAGQCIEELWGKIPTVNDQIKGDIIYVCGESASLAMISELYTIIDGQYSAELKEAAQEAIENIEKRNLG